MTSANFDLTSSLSSVSLASVLDQSVDCVKLVGLNGCVQYMNANGMCAMEIDDFSRVESRRWADLWPDDAKDRIAAAYPLAAAGEVVRFRAFCPTMKGTPRWWDVTVSSVKDDQGAHAGYLAISRDVTADQQGQDALIIAQQELRHRLKNTYTMISSLMMGFARGDTLRTEFAVEMTDRMSALSRAQSLFASDDAPCDLGELVVALVGPFNSVHCPVVIDELPDESLDQGRANAIALVMGELTVNASKHGAIAHGGRIHVSGRRLADGFTLNWAETSTRAVTATSRAGGQGHRLMERILRARGGSLSMQWQADGLNVALSFTD